MGMGGWQHGPGGGMGGKMGGGQHGPGGGMGGKMGGRQQGEGGGMGGGQPLQRERQLESDIETFAPFGVLNFFKCFK